MGSAATGAGWCRGFCIGSNAAVAAEIEVSLTAPIGGLSRLSGDGGVAALPRSRTNSSG